jgi:hypothetical protein
MRRTWGLATLIAMASCIDYTVTPQPPIDDPEVRDPGGGGANGDIDPWPEGTPVGGVFGTLCETAESGLAGVEMLIEHRWGVARTFTNADGYYRLENVPAGTYTLVAIGDDYFAQLSVLVPPNEIVELSHAECTAICDFPIPCVGLAEAVDRRAARLRFQDGLVVQNTSSDIDICIDDWMVALSDTSQDVLFGQGEPVHIAPGRSQLYPYSVDVYGNLGDFANFAWWCVERFQYIAGGSSYEYNGSLRPSRLFDLVHDRTDINRNGVEDHADVVDGQLQTQHNIWNTEAEHPIFLVGRERSLVRLTGPGSRPTLRVQVQNLGQVAGTARVTEIVPRGFLVSGVSPPAQIRALGDGSTELAWTVSLDAALPDTTYATPTRYDMAELTYQIRLGADPCVGRCEGNGAGATWTDRIGRPWDSASEPLIIEHCTPP